VSDAIRFAEIELARPPVRIEYQFVGAEDPTAPLLVFQHEGLGSLAMWKDFPEQLCMAGGFRGLVFSRPAYGRSTPRGENEVWDVDFMHRQAEEVLPAFFEAIGLADEETLAVRAQRRRLHRPAVRRVFPRPRRRPGADGAAHLRRGRHGGQHRGRRAPPTWSTDLPQKLSRYHDSADSAFWGWNHIWLQPAFRQWNIETELDRLRCPVLAIQGVDDQYGTLEQIRGIARRHVPTRLLEMPECGHSPHRDQPGKTIVIRFVHLPFITKNQET
jgi:pimeloyl-ACP methyl ester carboxylesterase